jgi:thiosulfate/3-mercaptopyruvate sulfurtransferase
MSHGINVTELTRKCFSHSKVKFTSILSTDLLFLHLKDPGWRVIDCRFDLSDISVGEKDYLIKHIPGAVYACLHDDLAGKPTQKSGRHPMPTQKAFLETCSRLGIDGNTQVVVYDQGAGQFASRLWFLLNYYGHSSVAVLDGGFSKWVSENKPTASGVQTNTLSCFLGRRRIKMIISTRELINRIDNPNYVLIDARSPERFTGQFEPIDPIGGHIPGAINRFYGLNLTENGVFRSQQALLSDFEKLLGKISSDHAILYCGSGVTACHHMVAIAYAGLPLPRLYAGSWSEWIKDPQNPVG